MLEHESALRLCSLCKDRLMLFLLGLGLTTLCACQQKQPQAHDPSLARERLLQVLPIASTWRLDALAAQRFADLSLECTQRQWPNKPSHVYSLKSQLLPPNIRTPAFFGCFDWHSAVHGHWALVRLLKTIPELPKAHEIRQRLSENLSLSNLAQELRFFQQPEQKTFERPYGWAWYLRLWSELKSFADPQMQRLAQVLEPLGRHFSRTMRDYLSELSVPIRAGTHNNTAFAMSHMLDAAHIVDDAALANLIVQKAKEYFLADTDCPTAYEPSGEDFLSGCLAEADLMRRILDQKEYQKWLSAFLPPVYSARFAPLRQPVAVLNPKDPKIGHLIGLAFHRAWCFGSIAQVLPDTDPRREIFNRLSAYHRKSGLGYVFNSGYGGSHWLATYVIYLATHAGR